MMKVDSSKKEASTSHYKLLCMTCRICSTLQTTCGRCAKLYAIWI